MKDNIPGNISISLLVGYIEETLDTSEWEKVINWIHSDPENRKYFELFEKAWRNPQDIRPFDREARESDWQVISSAIGYGSKPAKQHKPFLSAVWLRRAAGILLIVAFSLLSYILGLSNYQPLPAGKAIYHEITVPNGEKSVLNLSDGTTIWINANSHVRIPTVFSNESRDIWLDGEAYFEVSGDKNRPFFVHTSDLDVKVYGTKFNLKAYKDEDVIETTLVEGVVSLERRGFLGGSSEEIFLKPNQKAVFLKRKSTEPAVENLSKTISVPLEPKKILVSRIVETEPEVSWHEGKLVFMDESFESIAVKLERKFDVKIIIENENLKQIRYTGILKNISIEQALKAMQLSTNFEFRVLDNRIIITERDQP